MYFAFNGKVDEGLEREVLVSAEDNTEVICPVEVLEDMTCCPNVNGCGISLVLSNNGCYGGKIRSGGLRKPIEGANYATKNRL